MGRDCFSARFAYNAVIFVLICLWKLSKDGICTNPNLDEFAGLFLQHLRISPFSESDGHFYCTSDMQVGIKQLHFRN